VAIGQTLSKIKSGENMNCPKCNSMMEAITFAGTQVDRCTNCQGIWFDAREKEKLSGAKNSHSIDVGNSDTGRKYNEITKIDCPRCNLPMEAMIDKDQFHIQYEYCTSCYGSFLDAGEFRDLKEHTIAERFKQMVKTVRSNIK